MGFYRITCDDNLIMDTRVQDATVIQPKFVLETNSSGTLTFDITPDHPCYDRIEKLKSVIILYDGDEVIFRGRVIEDTSDFFNIKSIVCEGEMAFLLDSVVRPYDWSGGVYEYVSKLITEHNAQVEQRKRITLGRVTVTDPNDYIVRASSDYPSTWSELSTKCTDLLGGYFIPRYTPGNLTLDYLETPDLETNQVIQFGENMLDLSKFVSAADVATRIIPLGAQLEIEPTEETSAADQIPMRVTIAEVNDGKDYLDDADTQAIYGIVTKSVVFDDVHEPDILKQRGLDALEEQKKIQVSLELTALDLHLVNVGVEKLRVGALVDVVSKPHGLRDKMMITKIERDLENPAKDKVTLGKSYQSLTDKTNSNTKTVKAVSGESSADNPLLDQIYPVGAIYLSTVNISPANFLGGTWERFGEGRTLIGVGSLEYTHRQIQSGTTMENVTKTLTVTAGATGGEVEHALSYDETPMKSHTHTTASSGTCSIASSGGHSHTVTVKYSADAASGTAKNRPNNSGTSSATNIASIASGTGTHTHTVPNHTHTINATSNQVNVSHNNMQPWIGVHMWKRTA